MIRWWDLALAALAVLLGSTLSEQDTQLAPLVLLVVVGLAVLVWYLVVVWAVRDEPALRGAGSRAPGGVPGAP